MVADSHLAPPRCISKAAEGLILEEPGESPWDVANTLKQRTNRSIKWGFSRGLPTGIANKQQVLQLIGFKSGHDVKKSGYNPTNS